MGGSTVVAMLPSFPEWLLEGGSHVFPRFPWDSEEPHRAWPRSFGLSACPEARPPCSETLCSGVELSLLGHKRVPPDSGYGNDVTTHPLCLQPLKVVDPDHPLAALVRKAQADSPAPTPPSADGSAQPSQAEYAADCEYLTVRLLACGLLHSQPSRATRQPCMQRGAGGGAGRTRSLGSSWVAVLSTWPHPVVRP